MQGYVGKEVEKGDAQADSNVHAVWHAASVEYINQVDDIRAVSRRQKPVGSDVVAPIWEFALSLTNNGVKHCC